MEAPTDPLISGVEPVGWVLGAVYLVALFFSCFGDNATGNLIAGLAGIAVGVMTTGIFGTELADSVAEIASIPIALMVVFFVIYIVVMLFFGT